MAVYFAWKEKKKFKGEDKEKEEKQAVRLNGKSIPIGESITSPVRPKPNVSGFAGKHNLISVPRVKQ
jgi:hypothetical protein